MPRGGDTDELSSGSDALAPVPAADPLSEYPSWSDGSTPGEALHEVLKEHIRAEDDEGLVVYVDVTVTPDQVSQDIDGSAINARMGARVLAVASRKDGVELDRRLGADAVIDGRTEDVASSVRDSDMGFIACPSSCGQRELTHDPRGACPEGSGVTTDSCRHRSVTPGVWIARLTRCRPAG